MKTFKALKALKAFKALKGAYLERLPQNLGLPSATPAQKISISQSGIALQYAENHDGIEGYFNPRGVEKLQFLGGRPPSLRERENARPFESFWGGDTSRLGIRRGDRHGYANKLLEQVGLDSH
jgi:hypothetical protein